MGILTTDLEKQNTINDQKDSKEEIAKVLDMQGKIIYEKNPLDKNAINNIENLIENPSIKELLKKKAKTFIRVLREIAQNTFDHSIKEPKLSIEENDTEWCFYINTSNYFDWWEKSKEKLEETLKELNDSDHETIHKKWEESINDWEEIKNNWFSWAGLWMLAIAKKIKKMISWKIFDYKIKEENTSDGKKLYKLDLKTKFPMPDMPMAA